MTPKKADAAAATASKSPSAAKAPDVRPAPAREAGPVATPGAVVIAGATVLNTGPVRRPRGRRPARRDGKIAAVGRDVSAPSGALVIDGRGEHVTPG